jgi:hypothetical protein
MIHETGTEDPIDFPPASQYMSSIERLKREREIKKAKKKVRKEIEGQVGKKAASRLVKHAAQKVLGDKMSERVVANKINKAAARGV